MKKIVPGIVGLLMATSLIGCASQSAAEPEEATEEATVEEVSFDDLPVGSTASWDNYSITVDSVTSNGNLLATNVTMVAAKDSTFAARYMDAVTADGQKVSARSQDDVQVKAGETYSAVLTYEDSGIVKLQWNNWGNEASWVFNTSADSATAEQRQDITAGFQAVAEYGEQAYPYGFDLHYVLGDKTETYLGDDTWELTCTCDVTNEYGAKAKDLICTATVTGSGDDPSGYKVTAFNVA